MTASTLEELRRVVRRLEGPRLPRTAPEPVEAVVGGSVTETDAGPILAVRREYPLDHRRGTPRLGSVRDAPRALLRLLAKNATDVPDAGGLLFLDTETTGLAGGTGTYAFLVGTGSFEGETFVVTQYLMRDLDEEPGLLAALAPSIQRASAVVSFNGAGFDVPLLETRFVLGRHRWPDVVHVDLLHAARRVWGRALQDCRLETLERAVLGVERENDVPGAFIPSIYFAYLRSRQARPLVRVLTHNRDDVLSLAALLAWLVDAHGREHLLPRELAGLGALWDGVDVERSMALYAAALAGGLEGTLAQRVRLRLAWWEKRQARWADACRLWEIATAADEFDHRPWEELAKFHEHRDRDVSSARSVVLRALDRAAAASAPPPIVAAFRYRLARLEMRLARTR